MCGITAYLGSGNAFEFILASLRLLQNRGYDSAGIATLNSKSQLVLDKYASVNDTTAIDLLALTMHKHTLNNIGIGHTRWATHGAKTDTNAHPHTDSKGLFAVVHNGIIENYLSIKNWLIERGIVFSSNTDTEVIPKLLEYYYTLEYDKHAGDINFKKDILQKTIDHIQGTWAIVILYANTPNTLYLCKNGSPLTIGFSNDFALIASEPLPLSIYFNTYITLNDGDILSIDRGDDGRIIFPYISSYSEKIIENKVIETSCAPYPYWTLKEIFEQPQSIQRVLNMGGRILNDHCVKLGGLEHNKDMIIGCRNIILLGCGTSLNAAQVGCKILRGFKCFDTISCIDGSEFCIEDIPVNNKTGFILLSQSGETKDLHRCIELIRQHDYPIISIVNVVGSLIARESDCGIYLNAGREVGVASTKSFTSQVIAITLIGIWYSQNRDTHIHLRTQYIKSLHTLHFEVEEIIKVNSDKIKQIALQMIDTRHMFIMGRGPMKYIADEGALKIKELSYIHAEGYAGGALKHGPFALLDKDTIVILLAPRDENFSKMINTAEEIHSRNSSITLITTYSNQHDFNPDLFKNIIYIPHSHCFQTILSIIPLQLLAYELAIVRGFNPDFPRNLAKVVTVDG